MRLCEKEIRRYLEKDDKLSFELFETLPSTNTYLKAQAEQGAMEGLIVLAENQSAGRGRMGRSFSSPDGSGIYMSILLRPKVKATEGILITACAAVAVSEAIERVTGIKTDIKWVNDLYLNGKKVAGILAEGVIAVNGEYEFAVLGIGLNLTDTFGGTELENIATGLFSSLSDCELDVIKHRLIAAITESFFAYYRKGLENSRTALLKAYKERLFIIGRAVDVISYSGEAEATVIELCDDFTLKVRFSDGTVQMLNSGEVRLKIR